MKENLRGWLLSKYTSNTGMFRNEIEKERGEERVLISHV